MKTLKISVSIQHLKLTLYFQDLSLSESSTKGLGIVLEEKLCFCFFTCPAKSGSFQTLVKFKALSSQTKVTLSGK